MTYFWKILIFFNGNIFGFLITLTIDKHGTSRGTNSCSEPAGSRPNESVGIRKPLTRSTWCLLLFLRHPRGHGLGIGDVALFWTRLGRSKESCASLVDNPLKGWFSWANLKWAFGVSRNWAHNQALP